MVNGYNPTTLKEALQIRASEKVLPYAGGTDIMVKHPEGISYLFLGGIDELKQITDDSEYIRIGAAVTFTQALTNDLVPPLMKEAVSRIAAPAIRNAGTFGGNLGNGSDKADSVLAAFALDAQVRLVSAKGERIIPVEDFCVKRGVTALKGDELIAELLLPKTKCAHPYYYQKIGGRNALAISRVAFGGTYDVRGGVIKDITAAVIGGGDTCRRCCDVEAALIGKRVEDVKANIEEYVKMYCDKLTFSRGRVSAEYRRTVVGNLFRDFLGSLW